MSKVAYQGEPGAYSERAVKVLFPDAEMLPCETIRLTFSRVTSGEADFGVVPVENSQAGSVNESYDLLLRSSLVQLVGEVVLRVDHALLGPPGARLEGVRRAYSHWQALAQCEEFLTTHHIDPVPVHDTAGGARLVAERGSLDEAAIASVDAGANLGLIVLAEHIQTYPDNFTKFGVIGTRDAGLGPANKTSLVMAGDDRPGSLFRSLQPLADRGREPHQARVASPARRAVRVRLLHRPRRFGGGRARRGGARRGQGPHVDAEGAGFVPRLQGTGLDPTRCVG